jgi:hypothetical protein
MLSALAVTLGLGAATLAAPVAPDACALLPKADAQAAVGAPVGEPMREGGPTTGVAFSVCQYLSKSPAGLVRLRVERYESPEMLAFVTDDWGKRAGDQPISALGSRAVWSSIGRQLKVLADRDVLALDLEPAAGTGPLRDQALALTKKILARR